MLFWVPAMQGCSKRAALTPVMGLWGRDMGEGEVKPLQMFPGALQRGPSSGLPVASSQSPCSPISLAVPPCIACSKHQNKCICTHVFPQRCKQTQLTSYCKRLRAACCCHSACSGQLACSPCVRALTSPLKSQPGFFYFYFFQGILWLNLQ